MFREPMTVLCDAEDCYFLKPEIRVSKPLITKGPHITIAKKAELMEMMEVYVLVVESCSLFASTRKSERIIPRFFS